MLIFETPLAAIQIEKAAVALGWTFMVEQTILFKVVLLLKTPQATISVYEIKKWYPNAAFIMQCTLSLGMISTVRRSNREFYVALVASISLALLV